MEAAHPVQGTVRFGVFEFDCRSGELRRNEPSLKLQPQPAKVLAILVSRTAEIVTRQELAEQSEPAFQRLLVRVRIPTSPPD